MDWILAKSVLEGLVRVTELDNLEILQCLVLIEKWNEFVW